MWNVYDYALSKPWEDHVATRNIYLRMICIDRIRLEIY
jgi:hypothetical protein